jgi:chymotrypsin
MRVIGIAVFALLATSAYCSDDWSKVIPRTDNSSGRSGRIVGGNIVTPHSHPHQVGLLFRGTLGKESLCGGSLITTRSVLTAAHCPSLTRSCQVILGAHQITTVEPSQQRFNVDQSAYRIHPAYSLTSFQHDIAIIILPTAATLNNFVTLAVLPALGTTDSFAGALSTVTGWGRTSDLSTSGSTHLRWAQNRVITNEACSQFSNLISQSVLCTSTAGGSPCVGDSGGPLTVQSEGVRVQIGVVSFGPGESCETGRFHAFSRITSSLQWIMDNRNP